MMVDPEFLEVEVTSYALYRYEVLRQPRLWQWPQEELDAVLQRARQGDQDAREAVFLSCLSYVFYRAWDFADQIHHDDPMDLVSIGNIAMLEALDKALGEAANPIKYLISQGAYAMQHYVFHNSPLIKRDKHRNEVIPVLSIEKALSDETDLTLADLVGMLDEVGMLSEAEVEETADLLHGPLYRAIDQLTEKQRHVVIKHFGLDGAPETLAEIGRRVSHKPDVIWKNWKLARKRLQKLLGAYYTR